MPKIMTASWFAKLLTGAVPVGVSRGGVPRGKYGYQRLRELEPGPWFNSVSAERYATEAASAVLRHGFADLGLDGLVADINAANIASIGVAERIGLRCRGSKMAADRTLVRYALTRTEAEETSRQS